MLDMLIKGGQVVTPSGVGNWDVGVQGEQIVAVALPGVLPEEGATVIDATGRIVVPGGVEAPRSRGGQRAARRPRDCAGNPQRRAGSPLPGSHLGRHHHRRGLRPRAQRG